MSVFYDLNKTPRNILNQAIVRAIVSENNGALFDPSDLSTLYQDAAGTTPVTAVEQPVGLMLDKSRGLMLGQELVSNGDFSDGLTGWSVVTAGASTVTAYNGGARIISVAADIAGITFPYNNTKRRYLLVEFDVLSITGIGYVHVGNGAGSQVARYDFSTTGHKRVILYGDVVAPLLGFLRASTCDFVIDNISVREIYGYHATQSITASRPTLSARYNLLTKTEDFSDAVWGRVGVTVSGRTISFSASNTSRALYAITGGGDFTISCRFSEADAGKIIRFGFWASGLDGLGNGNSLDIVIPQNGFVSFSKSNVVSLTNAGLINASSGVAQSVTLMNGFGISLTKGTTSGPYQRVNTATDYDTDERYFKKFLRFDGVDDYLNLPYMGLYAAGSASVVMGVDDRTQTVSSRVFSESSSTTSSQYSMRNMTATGIDSYVTDDAGALFVDTLNTKGTESKNYIISAVDTGTNITRYRNSASENAKSYSRAGKTFTANKTTIGALDTVGAVIAYTAMNLYGLIITKSALTDSQRIACERHLGRKSGVQL